MTRSPRDQRSDSHSSQVMDASDCRHSRLCNVDRLVYQNAVFAVRAGLCRPSRASCLASASQPARVIDPAPFLEPQSWCDHRCLTAAAPSFKGCLVHGPTAREYRNRSGRASASKQPTDFVSATAGARQKKRREAETPRQKKKRSQDHFYLRCTCVHHRAYVLVLCVRIHDPLCLSASTVWHVMQANQGNKR